MVANPETERLMMSAKMRCSSLDELNKKGDIPEVIKSVYNIMFMVAKAGVVHLGAEVTNHRQVASVYRKELIGNKVIDRKYGDHLRKITHYRDEVLAGNLGEFEPEKLTVIIDACKDFIDMFADVIKNNPEPLINYDISDFA